jgi:NTE family protein
MDARLISNSPYRPLIGLALGGGAVRGLAHLGVISVLEQAGIPIDVVSGTSVGALVGCLYCAGMDSRKGLEVAQNMRWSQLANLCWPSRGFISFARMERWLVSVIGDLTFSDLHLPFAAATTDLDTGQKVILDSGRLAPAVRASCSIPGIIDPVEMDGRLLGDGVLVDSVPISLARRLGADYVIGVDILAHTVREWWGAFGFGLDALEILARQAGGGVESADFLITPSLAGRTYLRFSHAERLFECGRQAAEERLPALQADLARMELV